MARGKDTKLASVEQITHWIRVFRGHKVLLDAELATLYGVTTGRLNEAVKRNLARFPPDFMFQLTAARAFGFDIANCDIKARSRRAPQIALGLHGTWCHPSRQCAELTARRRDGNLCRTCFREAAGAAGFQ